MSDFVYTLYKTSPLWLPTFILAIPLYFYERRLEIEEKRMEKNK